MSKQYAYSEWLPKSQRLTEQDDTIRYFLDLDDEAPEVGPIVEATRKARVQARETHREFASWQEACFVIRNELREFEESMQSKSPRLDELLQVAACCQLAIKELGNTGGERELR